MVQLIASNQLTLTNLIEKAIDRTEISFWHGLSATKYPLGVYDCGNRDHQYGNEFNVTSGKTYTVRVIAKQTKGSRGLRGGIWYTAMTSGDAWDGFANFTLVGEVSEDGLGVYERKFAVESGKTKAKLFIQIDQWSDSSDRTTWRIYDGQVFDENGQPLVTDQNNYGALTSPMATPNGMYIWKRTIMYYTDGTRNTIWEYSGVGANGIAGKDGVGIQTTTITYANSTSGTTAPSTGWTSSVPTLVKGQYIWTKTVWTYTDTSSKTAYSVSYNSKDGTNGTDGTSGIIVSSVAPDSPQTGQLWQDTSATPQLVKKWTGVSWVIWELYAQNLKADSLETLSAKIGKLNNTYTVDYGAGVHTGTVTIENGLKIVDDSGIGRTITDFTSQSSGQGMFARYLPDKSDTAKYQQAWYTPFSLRFDDTVNNWHGQITAENVTLVPWTNLTYLSGFTTAENNPCQYRKIKNLDGSYTVQFKGQVKPVSGKFNATGEYLPLQVPAVIKPSINAFGMGMPDFTNIQSARIVVLASDGRVQLMIRGNATNYVSLDTMSYTL